MYLVHIPISEVKIPYFVFIFVKKVPTFQKQLWSMDRNFFTVYCFIQSKGAQFPSSHCVELSTFRSTIRILGFFCFVFLPVREIRKLYIKKRTDFCHIIFWVAVFLGGLIGNIKQPNCHVWPYLPVIYMGFCCLAENKYLSMWFFFKRSLQPKIL